MTKTTNDHVIPVRWLATLLGCEYTAMIRRLKKSDYTFEKRYHMQGRFPVGQLQNFVTIEAAESYAKFCHNPDAITEIRKAAKEEYPPFIKTQPRKAKPKR
jgi:hypothetical protein